MCHKLLTLFLSVAIFSVAINFSVLAYRNGAPDWACNDMTPSSSQHGPGPQAISSLPYAVRTKPHKDGSFTIWLEGIGETTFKGFLVKVVDGFARAVGQFTGFNSTAKGLCGGGADTSLAVTHTGSQAKPGIELTWLSPFSMNERSLYYIRITVVKDKRTFWTNYEVPLKGYNSEVKRYVIIDGRRTADWCGGYAARPFSGCTEFTHSARGITRVRQCPANTLFDSGVCTCAHYRSVTCRS